jgi:DNA helicase-2/ATP-dependent DNA helicase PcrA
MPDLSTLNPQQREAVRATQGPLLILAGAGTGKTRVITTRIAHLLEQGIAPGHVLGVTFTNKAAREMQERVSKLLPRRPRTDDGERPERPTICTFHSLCVRILRQHIERLGYKRNFVIFDESEQLGAIKKILSGISAKGEQADPRAILGLLSRFRNGGERASVFDAPEVRALAEHVRKRYESALRACNAVDFDDLILLTLRLFTEHADALEACRAKYRYVMVDEYQDTNAAQFQLVHALTREHRNLCVVGDDDQSIYGWRGAEVANLLDLEKHYPEVKIVKLEQNYRSTNTILNAANALIKHNVRRRPKQLWSQKGAGAKIEVIAYASDEEEAAEVVGQIEFNRLANKILWGDHAILFRTNLQSRPLETALRKAAVRYHLIGGQSFFDRREIRDFLAYLKTLLNPRDDISLLRIANTPARGLSDVTMERLLAASQERHCSVWEAMTNPVVTATFQARTRESLAAFVQLVGRRRSELYGDDGATPPDALSDWTEAVMAETGYFEEVRRSEKDREAGDARVRNLRDLIADMGRVATTDPRPQVQLQTFLDELTLDSDRESEDDQPGDAVTLITMHSCKGLEFPHVFIVGLEEGLLPHSRSKVEGTEDEERRLFYVALTRAMQTLKLSHCESRKKYGQLVPCHPSSFLQQLPAELVDQLTPRSKKPVSAEASKTLFAALRAAVE